MAQNQKHIHTFGTSAKAYVHGVAKNGAKTHWPAGLVEVRENNRVFLKSNNTFVGIEDNTVLTEETAIRLAAFDAAADTIIDEDDLEKTNMTTSEQTTTTAPTAVAAAFEKAVAEEASVIDIPGVVVTKKEAKSASEVPAPKSAKGISAATQAKVDAIQEKLAADLKSVTSTIKEKNMSKSESKPLSTIGVVLRVALVLALCAAIVIAIAFGGQLAVAYVATLGLSELATGVLTVIVGSIAGIASGAVAYVGIRQTAGIIIRRAVTADCEAVAA